ncbi:MAG TPA: MFS transporter [Patescibacteria group bacterium]|nr:MFS transporter [Patescibacteria group bacterium]
MPRTRWAYPVLGLVSTTLCGAAYAFSIFIRPLEAEFGWTRSETVLAFSVTMLLFGAVVAIGGVIVDSFGPRIPFVIGALLMGSAQILAGRVDTLLGLVLTYGVMLGAGIGLIYTSATVALATRWFPELSTRGLAIGVALAGMGTGAVIAAPLWTIGIAEVGWRATYAATGVVFFVVLGLVALVLRFPRPGEVPAEMSASDRLAGSTLREAVRDWRMWFMGLQFFLAIFGGLMVMSQVAAMIGDAAPAGMGLGAGVAAACVVILGLCNAAGRPLFGGLSGVIGIKMALILCPLIMASALGVLAIADSTALAVLGVILLGTAFGGTLALNPSMTSAIFGTAFVARIYGIVYFLGFGLGGFFGTQAGGALLAATGTHDAALLLAAGLAVVSAVLSQLFLPERGTERRYATAGTAHPTEDVVAGDVR